MRPLLHTALIILLVALILSPSAGAVPSASVRVSELPDPYYVELREIWTSWNVEGTDYDREDLRLARVGVYIEIYDSWLLDPGEYVFPFPQSQLQASFTCYICYIDDDQVVRIPYTSSTLSGVWYYSNIIWQGYGQWVEDFDLTVSHPLDYWRPVTYHIDSLYMQQYSLVAYTLPPYPPCPSEKTLTTFDHWPSLSRDPGEFYNDAEILEKISSLYSELTEESRGAFYGWSQMLRDRVSKLQEFIAEVRPTLTDVNAKTAIESSSAMAEQAAELLDLARSSAASDTASIGRLKQLTHSAWLSYHASILYGDASGYYEAGDDERADELFLMAEELSPQADRSYEASMTGAEWANPLFSEDMRALAAFLSGLVIFIIAMWILLPIQPLKKRRIWNVISVSASTATALALSYLIYGVI